MNVVIFFRFICIIILFSHILPFYAHAKDAGSNKETLPMKMENTTPLARPTISMLVSTAEPLQIGKENNITIQLRTSSDNKPVGLSALIESHTQKIHLLIIDPTLTDYHHIHPKPTQKIGEYVFSFTPINPGDYKIWADVVPVSTSTQEFVMADLKGIQVNKPIINKQIRMVYDTNGLIFKLSFDKPKLKVGEANMGMVTINTKDHKPLIQLEPIMGSYAHIVAFNEDFNTISHVHPMGEEPKKLSDRGRSELNFHIEPAKAGFTKIFVQVKIQGKELFIPLSVIVD